MSTDDRTPEPADRDIRDAFRRQQSRIAAHVDAHRALDHMKEPSVMSRRALFPALAAAAVVVVAVGIVIAIRPFGGGENVAGSTTTTAVTTTVPGDTSTTTSSTTTTAPTTTTTTTVPPAIGWEDARYHVVGVAQGDVLNVRANPGATGSIVGTLPPDGRVRLSSWPTMVGGTLWYGVMLDDGTLGFVNGSFLAPPEAWNTDFSTVACDSNDAAYTTGSENGPSPDGASDAGYVIDVLHYQTSDCERYVIVLGSGAYVMEDPAAKAASTWGAGTKLSVEGSIVAVAMPGGIDAATPWAQTVDGDNSFALATRDQPLSQGTSSITMRMFFDSNRRANFTFLDSPARIVVDVKQAPTGTGLDVAAKRAGTTVVMPVQVDVGGPGVTTPITVTGWARPFEATGVAQLRTVGATPGAGTPVDATFSGTDFAGTVTASSYPFMTTDYIEAWGAFSFTIEDVAPGTYELFVGELSMEDGSPQGVYQVFTVVP